MPVTVYFIYLYFIIFFSANKRFDNIYFIHDIIESFKNSENGTLNIELRERLINEYDNYIIELNEKNSASDSEEKISEISTNSTQSSISDYKEQYIENSNKIINTKFGSDPGFNIFCISRKIGSIINTTELLINSKKCLAFVSSDDQCKSRWYGLYTDGIKKVPYQNLSKWFFYTPEKSKIYLNKLLECNITFGFIVDELKNLPKYTSINTEKSNNININKIPIKMVDNISLVEYMNIPSSKISTITKDDLININMILNYIDMPLTHIFLNYKFDTEKSKHFESGTKLVKMYNDWKIHYIPLITIEINEKLHDKLLNDDINSSRGFTNSININTENGNDKIYRKEYGSRHWRIYRKQN
jgi:hypothetical protein